MKKILLVAFFCTLSLGVFGQVKLGLRFMPSLNINRVFSLSDTLILSPESASVKMALGLITELAITDNYSFATGINFAPKSVGIRFEGDNGGSYDNELEEYKVHYLQLPVLLKLYTDDFKPGARIYFQVGGLVDVKIFDTPILNDYRFIEKFGIFDASGVLGVGTEFEIGISTVAFGGLTYNRGLANIAATSIPMDSNPVIKNDYIQLEVGLKF